MCAANGNLENPVGADGKRDFPVSAFHFVRRNLCWPRSPTLDSKTLESRVERVKSISDKALLMKLKHIIYSSLRSTAQRCMRLTTLCGVIDYTTEVSLTQSDIRTALVVAS
jgi:hypothetical protein